MLWKVEHISQNNDSFTVYAMDHNGLNINYEAKMIVIATGNFDHPKRVGIKDKDTAKLIHYYKKGHPYYDQHVKSYVVKFSHRSSHRFIS